MDEELQKLPKTIEALLISQSSQDDPDNPVKWSSSDENKSHVVRISRNVRDGDFTIPAALVKQALPTDEQLQSFITRLLTESQSWTLPLKDVSMTKTGFLSIKLHRPLIFQKMIAEVFQQADAYGCGKPYGIEDGRDILINNAALMMGDADEKSSCPDGVGLMALRCVLVCNQLKTVFQKLGFTVHEVCHHNHPALEKAFQTFQIQTSSLSPTHQEKQAQLLSKLTKRASCSRFRVKEQDDRDDSQTSPTCREDGDVPHLSNQQECTKDTPNEALRTCVSLDLRRYLVDNDLEQGKGKFDRNIDVCRVMDEKGGVSHVVRQCCCLEDAAQLSGAKTNLRVIHIAPKTKEFHQQTVDLTWRIISDTAFKSQLHAVCGPVLTRTSGAGCDKDMTVEEFYRIREGQTREASIMKYGNEVKGDHWNEVIKHLTIAGTKFELLGVQLNSQIKLDVSDSKQNSTWPDSRDGVFVLYNYARLATLFCNYEHEIQKGVYPPLPSLDGIDFSSLRQDQEWGLLFNYILQYPVILKDVYQEVMSNMGPKVNLPIHKICGFLVSLSRDLSSYYSHVHMLGGGHSHLLPVMFARLYLMKAVQQVLRNGLSLLNIRPLEQM